MCGHDHARSRARLGWSSGPSAPAIAPTITCTTNGRPATLCQPTALAQSVSAATTSPAREALDPLCCRIPARQSHRRRCLRQPLLPDPGAHPMTGDQHTPLVLQPHDIDDQVAMGLPRQLVDRMPADPREYVGALVNTSLTRSF